MTCFSSERRRKISPIVGALASVVLIDSQEGLIWVRYANGNAGVLGLDDGPEVNVGTVLLVSFEDSSFVDAPLEVFPKETHVGSLGTVVVAPPEGPYWVRYANGSYGPLNRNGGPEANVGTVVLVSGATFVLAPEELQPPHKENIGVIRRVEATRLLVETEQTLAWIPCDNDSDWKEWSTVEIDASGRLRLIDERPIRYRDEQPSRATVHSRFRVDPALVTETFKEIKGLDSQIEELRQVIRLMHDAETLKEDGLLPIRGVLLAGESGTGKTMLARALANEANAVYFHVRGPEISSKWVNESEEMLRALMDEADSLDRAVVFFDEIDSLGGARSTSAHEMSNKLITQFLTLLDGFDDKPGRALIVGATNRPETLDPAMLRSGRFDRRIDFELPELHAREAILQATKPKRITSAINLHDLARKTESWCSADLRALWTRAFQFTQSEGRSQVLDLDCEVAIEQIAHEVRRRRAQIERTK